MAQKRKANHSKKKARGPRGQGNSKARETGRLRHIENILDDIENKTAHAVKGQLGGNWRDNLFEIMMTRLDLAAPHKKQMETIPHELRRDPTAIPHFARLGCRTAKGILKLAHAPAHPHHVLAFGVLYATVVDTYLKDPTRDHAKTMAALDKRLGWFEQFVDLSKCSPKY